jgi:thiol-disulfide isomerase/thioredoxin
MKNGRRNRICSRHLLAYCPALLLLACDAAADLPKAGEVFPSLSKFKLEGALPDIKGRVVLVDFWASWCAPCKKSFPVMKDMHEKFGQRGLLIVALSLDEEKSEMDNFLKNNPLPFPTPRDPSGSVAEALSIEKMPTSFLIGTDGKVIAMHEGILDETTTRAWLSQIEAALKSTRKPPK